MSALIEELGDALRPLMSIPFGFFGHSVGSYIAYEAARQLHSFDGRTAIYLFVSGRGSPASGDPTTARPRSDGELLAILERFGGTPAAIMQRPELVSALLPALRADLALADAYTVQAVDRLVCPITAFGGAEDTFDSVSLRSWSDFTHGKFRTRIFRGGHFYFSPAPMALAKEIVWDLRASLGLHEKGANSCT